MTSSNLMGDAMSNTQPEKEAMPDKSAFLAAAEAESKLPSVSVGLASGMIPPQLRELMRRGEGESGAALPPSSSAQSPSSSTTG